jgi:hypothetical protein
MTNRNKKPETTTDETQHDDDAGLSRREAYEALTTALQNAYNAGCFERGPKWSPNVLTCKRTLEFESDEGEDIKLLVTSIDLNGEPRERQAGDWVIRDYADTLRFKRTRGEGAGKWAGGLRPRAVEGTLEVKYSEFVDA